MSAKVFSLCLSAPLSMDSLLSEVILSQGSYGVHRRRHPGFEEKHHCERMPFVHF